VAAERPSGHRLYSRPRRRGAAGLFGRAAVKVGAKVLRNTTPGADLALDFIEEPLADQARGANGPTTPGRATGREQVDR